MQAQVTSISYLTLDLLIGRRPQGVEITQSIYIFFPMSCYSHGGDGAPFAIRACH